MMRQALEIALSVVTLQAIDLRPAPIRGSSEHTNDLAHNAVEKRENFSPAKTCQR